MERDPLECAALDVATRQYLLERGYGVTAMFVVAVTRVDGETFNVHVCSPVRLAELVGELLESATVRSVHCGRDEDEAEVRTQIEDLIRARARLH
jgi:hypothetical protein